MSVSFSVLPESSCATKGANLPEDAVYPLNLGDETGKPLDGSSRYTITFDKGATPIYELVILFRMARHRFPKHSIAGLPSPHFGTERLRFTSRLPARDMTASYPRPACP